MQFPQRFNDLPDYAFPRLRRLLDGCAPGGVEMAMSIGEPQHAFPDFVAEELAANIAGFGNYPPNEGTAELRRSIADWIMRRYGVAKDPDHAVVAINGSREGLFNACLALCPERKDGKPVNVLIPNPFYQVYAVAAAAAQATPVFVDCPAANGHLPNFAALPKAVLDQTAIAYICSPSNPQGAVASTAYWTELLGLAEKHDFRIFADECYSEIYRKTAPPGLLQVAHDIGTDPERVVVFHSLSKRSNLPGLRSGFVAGGPKAIAEIKRLRAYSGAPLPLPLQKVAAKVWQDEDHVVKNRRHYGEKYRAADQVFDGVQEYRGPTAGFFLWLPVDDGEAATLKLWKNTGVKVLPGEYLARSVDGVNPGKGFIRVAMVAPTQDMQRGLMAIRDCLYP